MILKSQKEKAEAFRKMHHQSDSILVLANAWDVPSARIFQQTGFPAIGTTSAGIAVSYGYPDGQSIGRDKMLEVVARIVKSVSIPVTADVEAGYGETLTEIADTATRVIATGAIGLNIEDSIKGPEKGLYNVQTQMRKIETIRKVAELLEVPLVINARTDALLVGPGDNQRKIKDVIERGRAYMKAGADCVFPVGAIDMKTISEIVSQLDSPVNILANPGVPSVAELKRIGVKRVSVGSGVERATLGLVKRIALELRDTGTYKNLLEGAPPTHQEANNLVS